MKTVNDYIIIHIIPIIDIIWWNDSNRLWRNIKSSKWNNKTGEKNAYAVNVGNQSNGQHGWFT